MYDIELYPRVCMHLQKHQDLRLRVQGTGELWQAFFCTKQAERPEHETAVVKGDGLRNALRALDSRLSARQSTFRLVEAADTFALSLLRQAGMKIDVWHNGTACVARATYTNGDVYARADAQEVHIIGAALSATRLLILQATLTFQR